MSGNIVWRRQVSAEDEKTVALGIQYQNMTPKLSGMLFVFADILHAAGCAPVGCRMLSGDGNGSAG